MEKLLQGFGMDGILQEEHNYNIQQGMSIMEKLKILKNMVMGIYSLKVEINILGSFIKVLYQYISIIYR